MELHFWRGEYIKHRTCEVAMARFHRRAAIGLGLVCLVVAGCQETAQKAVEPPAALASPPSPFEQQSVWTGEIRQGAEAFPATISINASEQGRIRGDIRFAVDGEQLALSFQGGERIVAGERIVVWITDRQSGNVTFPGLYIGQVNGDTLSGTWEVPSVGQFDTFEVVRQPSQAP